MLLISAKSFNKMQAVVAACNVEIGWYGFIQELQNNVFYLTDIFVPSQQLVSGATCTIKEEGDNAAIDWEDEMRKEYGDGFIRLWGHSHVDMGVNPSGQDITQFRELKKNLPYYFRLIMNKKGVLGITFSAFGYEIEISSWEVEPDTSVLEWATEVVSEAKKYSEKNTPNANYAGFRGLFDDDDYPRQSMGISYGMGGLDYKSKSSKKGTGGVENTVNTGYVQQTLPFQSTMQLPVIDTLTASLLYEVLAVKDPYNLRVYKYEPNDFIDISTIEEYYIKSSAPVRKEIVSVLMKKGYNFDFAK